MDTMGQKKLKKYICFHSEMWDWAPRQSATTLERASCSWAAQETCTWGMIGMGFSR